MNLIEEIDKLDENRHGDDYVYDPLLWSKMEIWREMAKRIEGLEEQLSEARRHCRAVHTVTLPQ